MKQKGYGEEKSNALNSSRSHEDAKRLLEQVLHRKNYAGGTLSDVQEFLENVVAHEIVTFVGLSKENQEWLTEECKANKLTIGDVLNSLVTDARLEEVE